MKAAEEAKDDMLLSYVPDRVIKLNQMILCCSITQIVDTQQIKVVKKKQNGKVVGKKVEKKAIKKKKNKLSKDERKILKL